MTALAVLQLRQHGVSHIDIVTVPCTIGDTEHLHIRVLTQVLQFILLIVRVHRHQYGTDLRSGVEERQPVGHVCRPDTHVRTFLHTNADQTLGEVIHTLIKFAPGEAQVTIAIYDIFFVWCGLSPILEPFSQGTFPQLIALRASLSRIGSVWQRSACHI